MGEHFFRGPGPGILSVHVHKYRYDLRELVQDEACTLRADFFTAP
jgi:hypothetical protein